MRMHSATNAVIQSWLRYVMAVYAADVWAERASQIFKRDSSVAICSIVYIAVLLTEHTKTFKLKVGLFSQTAERVCVCAQTWNL